ncbi:SRPBCC domain-containing protein [Streptomyces sp. SLBN-31]|uniref:SRPBCC domain-containing protein n=1 Tax=Streptomyces sp. SLBN-31 TaxID=2768444 RepID=UPI00115278E2|nr:SRPBCC domain-containing protein [Streptomyces sp. SLBN-31]TQJ85492.1 activator of Hsp90 ATPase-like protein [Streptomyces sp. SLBN-31]
MRVLHGPDGTDYQEWITWREILPPQRIALLHGESRDDPNAFESVLTFEGAGEKTRIVMRTVFPTKELRDEAVEKHHAIEGGEQTLNNLAAHVAQVARERSAGRGAAAADETMTEQETGQEGTVRSWPGRCSSA